MRARVLLLLGLAGCGNILGIRDLSGPGGDAAAGDDSGGGGGGDAGPSDARTIDGPPPIDAAVPAEFTITGTAVNDVGQGIENATLKAVASGGNTLASGTSAATGAFALSVQTGGVAPDMGIESLDPGGENGFLLWIGPYDQTVNIGDFPVLSGSDVSSSLAGCRNLSNVVAVIEVAVVTSMGGATSGATIQVSPTPHDFCYVDAMGSASTVPTATTSSGFGVAYISGAAGQTYTVTATRNGHTATNTVPIFPGVPVVEVELAP